MKSRTYSFNYIRTESRGRRWIPAFLTLGFFLAFPVAELIMSGSWTAAKYTQQQMQLLYKNLWLNNLMKTGAVVASLAGVFNAFDGFRYLYSGRQTDFYHSLPIKRERLFRDRLLRGMLYYLVPYMFMMGITLGYGAGKGFLTRHLLFSAVQMLGIHYVIYCLVYFSIVLVECLTGTFLAGLFCLAGLYLYGPALNLLLMLYGETFFRTMFTAGYDGTYGIFNILGNYASPGMQAFNLVNTFGTSGFSSYLSAALTTAAFMAVLAQEAFIRRPSEAAGHPVVYRPAAVIIKFMITVPAGLGTGIIMYMIPTGQKEIWYCFGLGLGTVLAHGLLEVFFQMDFRAFFRKKLQLVLAGVLAILCVLIWQKDLLGFDTYLPAQEKLDGIALETEEISGESYGGVVQTGKETWSADASRDWKESYFCGADGIGDKTYAALKKIVNEQKKRPVISGQIMSSDMNYYSIGVRYQLTSGRIKIRRYRVTAENIRELLTGLYEEENLKDKMTAFEGLDSKYLSLSVDAMKDDGTTGSIQFNQGDEKGGELAEALVQDIQSASAEEMLEKPCAMVRLDYSLPAKASVTGMIAGKEEYYEYPSWLLYVYPSYKNTLALLEKDGYKVMNPDEAKISEVTLSYWTGSEYVPVTYKNPQETMALRDALLPCDYTCKWLDYVYSADVTEAVYTVNGEEYSANNLRLIKEKLPDFVQEKLEEYSAAEESDEDSAVDMAVETESYIETVYDDSGV